MCKSIKQHICILLFRYKFKKNRSRLGRHWTVQCTVSEFIHTFSNRIKSLFEKCLYVILHSSIRVGLLVLPQAESLWLSAVYWFWGNAIV